MREMKARSLGAEERGTECVRRASVNRSMILCKLLAACRCSSGMLLLTFPGYNSSNAKRFSGESRQSRYLKQETSCKSLSLLRVELDVQSLRLPSVRARACGS